MPRFITNVPTSEYSPREVKKSIVGNGAASKEQVGFMIKTLLELKAVKMKSDESDALAIALCHAFRLKSTTKEKQRLEIIRRSISGQDYK